MTIKERKDHLKKVALNALLANRSSEQIKEDLKEAGANSYELTSVPREVERKFWRDCDDTITELLKQQKTEAQIIQTLHQEHQFPPEEKN